MTGNIFVDIVFKVKAKRLFRIHSVLSPVCDDLHIYLYLGYSRIAGCGSPCFGDSQDLC